MQWEKVKKAGLAPSPRTSVALATHKKRAIIFGGVTDQHGRGDHMFSALHDELYQFNLETRRWYPVAVKPPAKALANAKKDVEASLTCQNGSTDAVGTSSGAAGTSPAGTSSDQAAHRDEPAAASGRGGAAQGGSAQAGGQGESDANRVARSDAEQAQPNLADKLSKAGVDKESALYKAAARIQSRFRGYTVRKVKLLQDSVSAGKRQHFCVSRACLFQPDKLVAAAKAHSSRHTNCCCLVTHTSSQASQVAACQFSEGPFFIIFAAFESRWVCRPTRHTSWEAK